MTEKRHTDAEVAAVAQAMRDANTREAWAEAQGIPFGRFARAALDAIATARQGEPVHASQAPTDRADTDPLSQRVHALIFNGLTGAITEFMPLSERTRVSEAVYESLRAGGVEARLAVNVDQVEAICVHCGGPIHLPDGRRWRHQWTTQAACANGRTVATPSEG